MLQHWVGDKPQPMVHLLGTLKQPLHFLSLSVPLQGANLTRSHGEEGSFAAWGLSLTWRTGLFREAPESAASPRLSLN